MVEETYSVSNLEIAIMHKFNKLVERHGFNPCDFVATLLVDHAEQRPWALDVEMFPEKGKDHAATMKMLPTAGFSERTDKTWELRGKDTRDIYAALAAAIDKAPRKHNR